MKKLLGISLIAALAVSPMMAGAQENTGPAAFNGEANETPLATDAPAYAVSERSADDATHLATASYVKGAYDASIKAINRENARAVAAETAINNTIGDSTMGTEATTLTGAIGELEGRIDGHDTALGTLDNNNKIVMREGTADEAAVTVSQGLNALATEIDTLNSTMTDDFATKDGVEQTIKNTTLTTNGTVDVYTEWGADTIGTVDIAATTAIDQNSVSYAVPQAGNNGGGQQGE